LFANITNRSTRRARVNAIGDLHAVRRSKSLSTSSGDFRFLDLYRRTLKDFPDRHVSVDVAQQIAQHAANRSTTEQGFPAVPAQSAKISVLLDRDEAERFDAYCKEKGFKKSSLIARLIREHLTREGYRLQQNLFQSSRDQGSNR
jgi:hypothetical protein